MSMRKFPILIGGCPRSGTTALLQFLNGDPRIFISSEENLIEKKTLLNTALGTKERRQAKMAGKVRSLSKRESLNSTNIHTHNFTQDFVWPTIRFIYTQHHQALNTNHNLSIWGDKLPNYYKDINKLINESWVTYIHITRNPFDVVNSMLRRTNLAKQGQDWWQAITQAADMIEAWASAYQQIQRLTRKKNALHLHYEDLCFDTKRATADLSQFLEFDLTTDFKLKNNPKDHYERDQLTQEIIEKIKANAQVKTYQKLHRNNKNTAHIAKALEYF